MEEKKESMDLPLEECQEGDERESWDKKIDYIMSCIGNAVGFGNLWRFPYLCYSNGGGAFLIPYLLSLFLCGIPLVALELSLGQYFRQGPSTVFYSICPLLGGTGYSMLISLFLSQICYVVIFAWVLFYLIASFMNPLPWTTCGNSWNTEDCYARNGSDSNMSGIPPSQEFYDHRMLQITDHPDKFGTLNWELALLLLAAWVLIYFCVFKGIKWSGKVVYVTVTFPYLIMIILFFRGITLSGAGNGISYYLRIDTSKLRLARTWGNAATQIFYSLVTGFGPLITFSSYNKRSYNVIRDATVISLINCATSFCSGFVVFSVLGYIAKEQGLPVPKVVSQGPGLVFSVYPAALATLPGANFWSIIFFLMLITLGLDSAMGGMESLSAGITDACPKLLPRKKWVTLGLTIVFFLLGLTAVTTGGFYIFNLFNWYAAGIGLFVTTIFEIVAVSYCYGGNRFAKNIGRVISKPIWLYWKVCWYFLTPGMILVVLLFSTIDYYPIVYGNDIPYPWWGEFVGWLMTAGILCGVFIPAIYQLIVTEGTIKERFMKLLFVPKTEEELQADLACEINVDNQKFPPPPYRSNYSMYSYESAV